MFGWPDRKIVLKARSETAPAPATAHPSDSVPASAPPATSSSNGAAHQRVVVCPFCQYRQSVSPHGVSIFCRNCNKRIDLEGQGQTQNLQTPRASVRFITCPACESSQEVPANALSAFCHKCGKRINMQDYQIRGKFNGDIQTKGTLTIAIGGDVRADVHVGNAIIEGKLFGTLRADGKVELRSTGFIQGDIYTKALVVHDGATLLARCTTAQ